MAFKLSGNVSQYSVEDLAQYLLDREVRTGLVVNFRKNLVNGAAFLQLTEEDLKELVPLVGERVLIRQLLKQSKLVCFIKKNPTFYSLHVNHTCGRGMCMVLQTVDFSFCQRKLCLAFSTYFLWSSSGQRKNQLNARYSFFFKSHEMHVIHDVFDYYSVPPSTS